jgi:hypothetical protein
MVPLGRVGGFIGNLSKLKTPCFQGVYYIIREKILVGG